MYYFQRKLRNRKNGVGLGTRLAVARLGTCTHSQRVSKSMQKLIVQVAELASLAQLLPLCSPTCVIRHRTALRQSCCSPIASTSAAARHLCLLQLLLPDCVRFNCSTIASASAVAPRLHPLNACSLTCSGRFQPMPNVLERSPRSSRFSKLKYEGRASL